MVQSSVLSEFITVAFILFVMNICELHFNIDFAVHSLRHYNYYPSRPKKKTTKKQNDHHSANKT